jgi:hypothetical protein
MAAVESEILTHTYILSSIFIENATSFFFLNQKGINRRNGFCRICAKRFQQGGLLERFFLDDLNAAKNSLHDVLQEVYTIG